MASKLLTMRRLAVVTVAAGIGVGIPVLGYNSLDNNEITGRTVQAAQLPIYQNPEDKNVYEFVPEEPSQLKEGITTVRKATWEMLDSMKDTTDRMNQIYETSKAHTETTVEILKEDPYGPGIILLATVTGLGLGAKGGHRLRGLTLGIFSGVAAASLYYPNKSVSVFNDGMKKAKSSWKEYVSQSSTTKQETEKTDKSEEKS